MSIRKLPAKTSCHSLLVTSLYSLWRFRLFLIFVLLISANAVNLLPIVSLPVAWAMPIHDTSSLAMDSGSREHTSRSDEAILEQTSSISPPPEDFRTLTTQSSNGIVNYNVLSSANNDHQRTEFHSKSRDAFLRLDSKPYIEPPLLPDEERRQIWLERHRHKHQHRMEKKEGRKEEIPGRKRVLTLTTVDFLNRNQTCTGDLFKHKVRMSGCEPKIIINRFCHGSCASFYIPKLRSKKLKATFRSCAACVPSETDLIQVKLNCPEREEKEIYRTVMRVKKCACRNIELDDEDDDTEERDY